MKTKAHTKIATPVGTLYIAATARGLSDLGWKAPNKDGSGSASGDAAQNLKEAKKQIEQYFAGERKEFDLPLDLEGTDFQKKVWRALMTIPYGQTTSYADLAKKVGSPKAFRAVGSANGRNPVPILVPCHRVIAADGTIGGYSGGVEKKEALLALEQTLTA